MLAIEPLDGLREIAVRLTAATLIGGAIGLNRELADKPAGMRTHALVSLGTALAVITVLQLTPAGVPSSGDPVSRVMQGLLTGIGFLGGGVILHTDGGKGVRGLTTAATIWVVACLGIACGAGLWAVALTASALTLVVLIAGDWVEQILRRFLRARAGRAEPDGEGRHASPPNAK